MIEHSTVPRLYFHWHYLVSLLSKLYEVFSHQFSSENQTYDIESWISMICLKCAWNIGDSMLLTKCTWLNIQLKGRRLLHASFIRIHLVGSVLVSNRNIGNYFKLACRNKNTLIKIILYITSWLKRKVNLHENKWTNEQNND